MIKIDLLNNPFLEGLKKAQSAQLGQKALGALGGAFGMAETLSNVTSNIPQVAEAGRQWTADRFGTPVYNLGNLQANVNDLKESDVNSGGIVASTALQGVSAGANFGVPGAIIGGVGGAIAGLFGATSAEDERQKRIQQATERLKSAQQNFNEQNEEANRNRLAYEQYMQMIA